jgi:hypothetical protein
VSWNSIVAAVIAAGIAVAGCGAEDPPETPSVCAAPAAEYLAALESAPSEVRLPGGTPISDCLVPEQEGGALANVGQSMIAAATELNQDARRDPTGPAAVELGYLVGAVEKATDSTSGIHEDLKLRLNSAARFAGPGDGRLAIGIERGLTEGYAAAQAHG